MSGKITPPLIQVRNGNLKSVLETLVHAKKNSPFYANSLSGFSFTEDLTHDQIRNLPFTTKEDVSQDNRSFLAVPLTQVAEYNTTSGTSGEAITLFLTKSDLVRLAKNERDSLALTGANSEDVFQLMTTIDKQFMAGLAYYLGVQELNAGMIRIGPGVPALQWRSILLYNPTVLIAVPSFIINLIDYAKSNQIDFKNSSVRSIVCIGEAIREDDFSLNVLGTRIKEDWNVELFSTYASTEMGSAFTECVAQKGCHLNDELLYLEVLNENGDEVDDGEIGEITVTTIGTIGTPLIRYKTGDLARVYKSVCGCGKDTPRLGPIVGRKNQMIKFKGTTIFPNSVFEIFDRIPTITCYKVEITKDYLGSDVITVLLEKKVENSQVMTQIVEACKSRLRVVPHFVFLESDYLRSQVYKNNSRKPEKIIFK
jgi:phenylacetate-CoA ligase